MSMVTFAAYLDGQTFMDYVALPSVNMIVNMGIAPDLTLVLVKLDGQVQIARSAYAYLVATTDTVICRSNVDVDLDGQECFVISPCVSRVAHMVIAAHLASVCVTLVGLVKIVQNASHFLDVTGEMGIVANLWNANVMMDTLVISANMQIVQQDATHNMAIALTPILVGVIQVGPDQLVTNACVIPDA